MPCFVAQIQRSPAPHPGTMSSNCPLLQDILKLLNVDVVLKLSELIGAANTIASILSSIAKQFEAQTGHSVIEDLSPKVHQCLELSQQYKHACINVAEVGACEYSFVMLKEQLAKGYLTCLRTYVNDIREALQLCDICCIEFKSAFELTKTDIKCAAASTQGKITAAETGIKDSVIATGIGGAVMSSGIVIGIPLAFLVPPLGLTMLVAGVAGAATLGGGAVGVGVHRSSRKQQTEILVQIQTLNECLNNSKLVIDNLEYSMTLCISHIDQIDRLRRKTEQRQKLSKSDEWQIEQFLSHTYHELRDIQRVNSV